MIVIGFDQRCGRHRVQREDGSQLDVLLSEHAVQLTDPARLAPLVSAGEVCEASEHADALQAEAEHTVSAQAEAVRKQSNGVKRARQAVLCEAEALAAVFYAHSQRLLMRGGGGCAGEGTTGSDESRPEGALKH